MKTYDPPVADHLLSLRVHGGLAGGSLEPVQPADARAVLDAGARFARDILAPLDRTGDRIGAQLREGQVIAPAGFAEAYRRFVANGWQGVACDPAHGGQGLPWPIAACLQEMWHGANMSFGLCPLLTQSAVELLATRGSDSQRARYLPPLVSGAWSGTMCMTEAQAGSEVSAIRTRAEPEPGHPGWYRLRGQKIYITWGEHDLAENIVHMVLARTGTEEEGARGLSLFIVPKMLPAEGGAQAGTPVTGRRNDVRCLSLEHKLGIHASPTCVMAFGEEEGALGEIVGEPGRGLAQMFVMMNAARLAIGIQALGVAESAFQAARAFAGERVQGRRSRDGRRVTIDRHPDVRRMLLDMRARIGAMRALAIHTATTLERSRQPDGGDQALAELELLTPIVKAWCSDEACRIASTALQVFGGMGYVEESGIAQIYRDVRITPIYEGTNGIQAADLVFRKLIQDEGRAMETFLDGLRNDIASLRDSHNGNREGSGDGLSCGGATRALDALSFAGETLLAEGPADPDRAGAAAVPYLDLAGRVIGGALLLKEAVTSLDERSERDEVAAAQKRRHAEARYWTAAHLGLADGLARRTTAAAGVVADIPSEHL